jgi:hypothetical protein
MKDDADRLIVLLAFSERLQRDVGNFWPRSRFGVVDLILHLSANRTVRCCRIMRLQVQYSSVVSRHPKG